MKTINTASKYTKNPGVVIPELDQGIQSFQQVLDCPVKPDNDDIEVSNCRVNKTSLIDYRQVLAKICLLL